MSSSPSDKEDYYRDESLKIEKLQARFNGALVIVGCMGFAIAFWQGCITQKQLGQMVLDQRPWIQTRIRIEKPEAGQPLKTRYEHVNSGKSPAHITGQKALLLYFRGAKEQRNAATFKTVRERIRLVIDDRELVELKAGARRSVPRTAAPPNAAIWFDVNNGQILNESDTVALNSGDLIYINVCYVVYTDQGGNEHHTLSCLHYDPKTGQCFMRPEYNEMD